MARRYSAPQCSYSVEGNVIRTDGSVHNKVTGTGMAAVLGCSPWTTPFQLACSLLGLGRENIDGKPAVETGKALEPVVIDYLGRTFEEKGLFLPAEKVFEKREGDHDSWVSDFSDDYFAGHVDGIVMRKGEDGESVEHILEIKTSANLGSWAGTEHGGVPVYYYWQVALYNEFLTQKDTAFVGLGVVDKFAYANPQSWIPSTQTVALYEMPIDREEVQEGMQKVREWYDEFIMNNVTPPYNPDNADDVELFNHLKGLTSSLDEVRDDLEKLADVDSRIQMKEMEYKDLIAMKEDLQSRVKDYMAFHNLASIDGEACIASLSSSERKTLDKGLLKADGINPEKYMKTSVVSTFRLKKRD